MKRILITLLALVFATSAYAQTIGPPTGITIGAPLSGGTTQQILIDNAGVLGEITKANNGVLITSGAGVPSISSTLPTAVQNNITSTGTLVSPTFSGTATGPTIAGGSAAGSTLTLESTSGAGTTDSVVVKTGSQSTRMTVLSGGNIGIGTETNPQAPLVVSANATTGINNVSIGQILQLTAADANGTTAIMYGFGTTPANAINFYGAANTAASPSAVTAGTTIGQFGWGGYAGATATWVSNKARIMGVSGTNTWSNTDQGIGIEFDVTPVASTTRIQGMQINPSGGVYMGQTNADPGTNSAAIQGQLYMANITTSSAAQSGTVCWTSGGSPAGKFTADTTVGCLTSLEEAKNILGYLNPADALRLVEKLEPFFFRYKMGWGDDGHYEQFGLGAHQVASVDERMVGRDPEGTLRGVRYQELTAVLVGAIKEVKAQNDSLRVQFFVLILFLVGIAGMWFYSVTRRQTA